MAAFENKKNEDSPIRNVGPASFPERILSDHPDLSVFDYLRYRLTSQLPAQIEEDLAEGTKRFISGALSQARMPDMRHTILSTIELPESAEQFREQEALLLSEINLLLDSDIVPVKIVERLAENMRLLAELSGKWDLEFPSGSATELAERALVRLTENSGDADTMAACLLVHLSCKYPLNEVASGKVLGEMISLNLTRGRTDTVQALLNTHSVSNLSFYTIFEKLDSAPSTQVTHRVINNICGNFSKLDHSILENYLIRDHRLGEYGRLLEKAIIRCEDEGLPFTGDQLMIQAKNLADFTTCLMKKGAFICHQNVIGILGALDKIYSQCAACPEEKEKLSSLFDMIIEDKIVPFSRNYPNVPEVRKLLNALSTRIGTGDMDIKTTGSSFMTKVSGFFSRIRESIWLADDRQA